MTPTEAIADFVEEGRKRWRTVDTDHFGVPWPCDLGGRACFVGIWSTRDIEQKRAWYDTAGCLLTPAGYETPSRVARAYLSRMFPRPRWAREADAAIAPDKTRLPLYARSTRFDHGYYVDLDSAYPSLINRLGWSVDYRPGQWLGQGRGISDCPFLYHKVARSCLLSVATVTSMTVVQGEAKRTVPIKNPLLNWPLLAAVRDVLTGVAEEWIGAGAVYVNTDGCIMENDRAMIRAIEIAADWGLSARVAAEGEGYVTAIGRYKVGRRGKSGPPSDLGVETRALAEHRPTRWLKRQFSALDQAEAW